jgi:hypothetical protein
MPRQVKRRDVLQAILVVAGCFIVDVLLIGVLVFIGATAMPYPLLVTVAVFSLGWRAYERMSTSRGGS